MYLLSLSTQLLLLSLSISLVPFSCVPAASTQKGARGTVLPLAKGARGTALLLATGMAKGEARPGRATAPWQRVAGWNVLRVEHGQANLLSAATGELSSTVGERAIRCRS